MLQIYFIFSEKTDKDLKMDSLVSCFTAPARKHRTSSTNSETSERSQKLSETSDSSEENIKIKEDVNISSFYYYCIFCMANLIIVT